MGRVVHFELSTDDPERAVEFYQRVFNWKVDKWEGPVDYWMLTTGEAGAQGIDGAIMRRDPGLPQPVINTLDVESIDRVVARVVASGGSVVVPKHAVPGVGYNAYCRDTEGNIFGVMEADPAAA